MSTPEALDRHRQTSLRDPARVEAGCVALARRLPPADAVLCWDAAEDAVLGHILARELQAQLWLATDIEGILSSDGVLPAGSRVVIACWHPSRQVDVTGLAGLVAHQDAQVVAFAGGEPPVDVRAQLPAEVSVVVRDTA